VDATLPPPPLFFMGIDCIHSSASAAHGSNGDMLLLLDFKRAITGDRHRAPGSWNATTPFCQRDRVLCSWKHQRRVMELHLGGHRAMAFNSFRC